jgi:hypothetical protein
LVRFVVPDVLDATQCGLLANEIGYRGFDDPILEEAVRIVSEFVETDFADPSYMRVECRKEGHDWHLDNGKHMPWCGVSASILLTNLSCPKCECIVDVYLPHGRSSDAS